MRLLFLGNIGSHRVVCTKLPTVGHTREAMIASGSTTTRRLGNSFYEKFKRCCLLSGGWTPNIFLLRTCRDVPGRGTRHSSRRRRRCSALHWFLATRPPGRRCRRVARPFRQQVCICFSLSIPDTSVTQTKRNVGAIYLKQRARF